MAQQVNISQCARMYGKDRRWVYNRIKQHGISTQRAGEHRTQVEAPRVYRSLRRAAAQQGCTQ